MCEQLYSNALTYWFLCSAAQCSAAQRSAVQHSAVQCSIGQHSAVQHSAAQCSAVQCSTLQCSTAQHKAKPKNNLGCLTLKGVSRFSLPTRKQITGRNAAQFSPEADSCAAGTFEYHRRTVTRWSVDDPVTPHRPHAMKRGRGHRGRGSPAES